MSCQLQRYLPSLLFNGTKWHSLFGALKVKEKNLGLHPIQFNIVYYVYIYILLGCHYHEHLVVDEHFLLYCYIFGIRCCIRFGNYSVLSNGVQFCEFFFFLSLKLQQYETITVNNPIDGNLVLVFYPRTFGMHTGTAKDQTTNLLISK